MEKKINYKKILDKLEMVSRIATHQRKRIINKAYSVSKDKPEKMEILNDAIIVMERYLAEITGEIKTIKGYTALPDKDMNIADMFVDLTSKEGRARRDKLRDYMLKKAEQEMKIK